MARKSKSSQTLTLLERMAYEIERTLEEREREEAIDREARRRGRYYRGVARRIRYGRLDQEELASLREDKKRVSAMREKTL